MLSDFGRDVSHAVRLLRRRPAFAAIAVVTLALGIGAPTAIFSVVHAVLLRPLAYPDPDRVVSFHMEARTPAGPVTFDALPVTEAMAWGTDTATLSALAFYNDRALTLASTDGPYRLSGISATPNLFEVLGVTPTMGRAFDAATSDARQVVISHATWLRFFSGQPSIVGTSVSLDGEPYRVVGVMPDGFGFPTPEAAFWVPQTIPAGGGRGMLLPAVGRLRPGSTVAAVEQEGRRVLGDSGDARVSTTLFVRTLRDQMVGGVSRVLWVLMAAVGIVFVIATVNIALLLLTRGASREREFSVRLALGAARSRLVRQLFIEAGTLAVLGGAVGIGLAGLALELLLGLAPPDLPRLQEASLDLRVLAFAIAVTAVTSLIFGVLSAGPTLGLDPVRALAGSTGESRLAAPAAPVRRRLNLLASGELALTLVLLVGAGLLLRSFVGLVLVDQGFKPKGALAFQINLPLSRYPSPAARLAFHERLLEALKTAPGVATAGLITAMPNRQPTGRFDYNPAGISAFPDPFTTPIAEVRMASEGFFEAMGIPILRGRSFRPEDGSGVERVIVISEALARLHFPGKDPIGQLLYSRSGTCRVIGVVGDVRPAAPASLDGPSAYLPIRQQVDVFSWVATMNVVVRGGDPSGLARSLRGLLLSLDANMPPSNVRSLDDEIAGLVAGPRFSAALLSTFAVIALVMAAIGVYGVMAYSAEQRTREIGLRVALGATRAQVLQLIMRDGCVVVLTGLVAGLLAAAWLAHTLTGLLHEVAPADPWALASVALLLSAVGLSAAYLPARRATRVSALDALRTD